MKTNAKGFNRPTASLSLIISYYYVAVSSLIARGDSDIMEEKRNHVNQILERSLVAYDICFIKHNNIDIDWRDCLWKDGIHLSDHGSAKFTGNFIRFLNDP